MRALCADMAELLRAVAAAEGDEDDDVAAQERPKPPPAPQRFATAVQAALAAGLPPSARFGFSPAVPAAAACPALRT